jgi:AraC-like DNA-binding protein
LETPDFEIEYKIIDPEPLLLDFVERFYMLKNHSNSDKEVVLIPDGRIDIFFSTNETKLFNCTLIGLETQPSTAFFPARSTFLGVSLKLLSVEYILNTSISDILNTAKPLPIDFFDFTYDDFNNFDGFCSKLSNEIKDCIHPKIDVRKQNLFNLIYETYGSLTIKEYAEKTFWKERQINRYFNQFFGLSLKVFCNILRFKASFKHINNGILYPEQNYSDQAHFIREVKKLTKVTPKELFKNKNDRFVQFSTLTPK